MPVGKKIIVTGANGQLGSELRVLAPTFPQYDFKFVTREELSISDEAGIRAFFRNYKPDFCINCAAYTAVDKAESEIDLAFGVNAGGTGLLAAMSRKLNCRFIHISTDYIFNGAGTRPYLEDDPPSPGSVYGASKLEGERLAFLADPFAIIIRTSWVYSAFGKNFVRTMLRLMQEREEIGVVNDQIGSPTYAADLAEAIMHIIEFSRVNNSNPVDVAGAYHFSNSGQISWFDFAEEIKSLTGSHCRVKPIKTIEYPTPAKRPAYSVLDNSRIKRVFGIEIKDWKESLAVCLQRIKKEI